MMSSVQSRDGDWGARGLRHAQGIAKCTAEARELNGHDVVVNQADVIGKAQAVRAIKMHVDVARTPVCVELEVVMLDVCQAMTHLGGAGCDVLAPELPSVPFYGHPAGYRFKLRIDD